jgi:hypothetical protein
VPKLKGKTLRAAKRAIRLRACTVGKIGSTMCRLTGRHVRAGP